MIATPAPAMNGTRSKNRSRAVAARGLVNTWVGVDMLLVDRKPIRETSGVQFTTESLYGRGRIHLSGHFGYFASQTGVSAPL